MARKVLQPIHPGEILLEEFLEPLGLSQYRLAKGISVPPRRINEIGRTLSTDFPRWARASSPPVPEDLLRRRGLLERHGGSRAR